MIDLNKIEQLAREGKGLTRKEVVDLLKIQSNHTFKKRLQQGYFEKIDVCGEICYTLKAPKILTIINSGKTVE